MVFGDRQAKDKKRDWGKKKLKSSFLSPREPLTGAICYDSKTDFIASNNTATLPYTTKTVTTLATARARMLDGLACLDSFEDEPACFLEWRFRVFFQADPTCAVLFI